MDNKNKQYENAHDWIVKEGIKSEKGDPMEFTDSHRFLLKILLDESQKLVVMKPAQIGMTTLEMLRNHYDAKYRKLDIIYTLPTDGDVRVMVGSKTNRIISNNPCMLEDVADKDSIEAKKVGDNFIYFRGTWTKKSAMMTPADRVVHDEVDTSKLDIIADYQARLQHSKWKETHIFSHPSLPNTGVHAYYKQSDQKHWFIRCRHCGKFQYLEWNTEDPKRMSVCFERKIYQCKKCHGEITDDDRRNGRWIRKYKNRKWSGYWVSLMMAPWYSAEEMIEKFQHPDTTMDFFCTKILGVPFADASSKLLRNSFFQNLTGKLWAPNKDERVIIGIDTGLRLDYVIGNEKGLFYHDDCDDYGALDELMKRWPKAIAVIDQGGDLIGSRKFYERWTGRVFLCTLTGDRTTKELVRWGSGDEHGAVTADRNRMIQLVVDEFRNGRIPVHGTEEDWFSYWLDWNNLSKKKILDPETNQIKQYKWIRNGRDHRALATIFWRIGMRRFASMGGIVNAEVDEQKPNSYIVNPNQTADFDPDELFRNMYDEEEEDWRAI